MVNILSIAHSYVLSVNRKLPNEISRLTDDKWQVTTVAPSKMYADFRQYQIETNDDELAKVIDIPLYLSKRVHVMYYHPYKLAEILDNNWNLIHAWEEPYIFAGGQIALESKKKIPLVYRTAQSYNKNYYFPFSAIERYSMSQAKGWICSGRLVADTLSPRPGYQLPMKLIPLGVDTELFFPDRQQGRSILTDLNWEDRTIPVIGYLGRLVEAKGLNLLMDVCDRLSEPWRLLLVGSGDLLPKIESWASKFPERVRIVTNARHTDIPKYLNAMDVLVAPSQSYPNWREQFGRMLVEAMACGVPVIGSSSGEIPYTIGDAGVVVDEKNVTDWVEAIENLLNSPTKKQEFIDLGFDKVKNNYSWTNVARSYIEFFEEIMSSSPAN